MRSAQFFVHSHKHNLYNRALQRRLLPLFGLSEKIEVSVQFIQTKGRKGGIFLEMEMCVLSFLGDKNRENAGNNRYNAQFFVHY